MTCKEKDCFINTEALEREPVSVGGLPFPQSPGDVGSEQLHRRASWRHRRRLSMKLTRSPLPSAAAAGAQQTHPDSAAAAKVNLARVPAWVLGSSLSDVGC